MPVTVINKTVPVVVPPCVAVVVEFGILGFRGLRRRVVQMLGSAQTAKLL